MSAHRSLKQGRTSGRRQVRISAFVSPRVIHAKARKSAKRQERLTEETNQAAQKGISVSQLREEKYNEVKEARKRSPTVSGRSGEPLLQMWYDRY